MDGYTTDSRPLPPAVERLGSWARLDLPRGAAQPSLWRFLLATAVAIGWSLLACRLLAAAAMQHVPSTRGYGHFQFADYGKFTVVGVVAACIAWPVVTWFSTRGRRILLVLAVLVTLASFLPDIWIGVHGQPAAGVWTLVLMHVALLVVTYPALVLIAPQRRAPTHEPRPELLRTT